MAQENIRKLREVYDAAPHNLTARTEWNRLLDRGAGLVLFNAIADAEQEIELWKALVEQMGERLEEAQVEAEREREALLADTAAVRQAAANEREQAQREMAAMADDLRAKEATIGSLHEQVAAFRAAAEKPAPVVVEPAPKAGRLASLLGKAK